MARCTLIVALALLPILAEAQVNLTPSRTLGDPVNFLDPRLRPNQAFMPGVVFNARHPLMRGVDLGISFLPSNSHNVANTNGVSVITPFAVNGYSIVSDWRSKPDPAASQYRGTDGLGIGLGGTANSNAGEHQASNGYDLPQSEGTVLAYVRVQFASNDSATHRLFWVGANTFPNGPGFLIQKFSDNTFQGGWFASSTDTVLRSTSGAFSWSANEAFTLGVTWTTSGTKLWVKGTNIASSGTTPATGTTGSGCAGGCYFVIGAQNDGGGLYWNNTARSVIHWVVVWSRALSDDEIMAIELAPASLLTMDDNLRGTVPLPSRGSGGKIFGSADWPRVILREDRCEIAA